MRIKGTRKIAGGLTLAALFALTGVAALAQQTGPAQGTQGDGQRAERQWGQKGDRMGRRGDRGGDFAGPFERLNLTDAQREQMSQIADRYRQTFEGQRERRGEGRRGGFDPLAGGAFDEAAVRAAAQARANAQVEREVAQARMMYEMYNVLTAEQKSQLAAERQQRQQRRQEFRSRRGGQQQQQQWQ
jgi:Spy/CpxP family protein refolding chaperone